MMSHMIINQQNTAPNHSQSNSTTTTTAVHFMLPMTSIFDNVVAGKENEASLNGSSSTRALTVGKREADRLLLLDEPPFSISSNKRQRLVHDGNANCNSNDVPQCRHDKLVDAMWTEAQDYWLLPHHHHHITTICERDETASIIAKRLLRGIQLETFHTQPLSCRSGKVRAAEKLELTFSLPTTATAPGTQGRATRTSYHWLVSWYDIHGPSHAVAGSMRCQPFVEDSSFENLITRNIQPMDHENNKSLLLLQHHQSAQEQCCQQVDDEHFHGAHQIQPGWNLKRMNQWDMECAKWLRGAGLATDAMKLEAVARLVCAGVGVLARDYYYNHNNNNNQNTYSHPPPSSWVLKKTILRLERELQTWNNPNAKDPNVMDMSEAISRRGGLLSKPSVAEALCRENRWDKPVVLL